MTGTYDFAMNAGILVVPRHTLAMAIDSISNQITGRSVNFQIKNLQIAFPSSLSCVHIGIKEVTVMQFFALIKKNRIESYFYFLFRNIYVYKYDNMIVNRIKCTDIRDVSVIFLLLHSMSFFYLHQYLQRVRHSH